MSIGDPSPAQVSRERPDSWPLGCLLATILSLPAALPLLQPGLPVTADSLVHVMRAVELDAAVRGGVLYPRWGPDLFEGYGFPVFNFYAPLTLYVTELAHLAGLAMGDAHKLVLGLSLVLAAVAMYVLVCPLAGQAGGLLAATLYAYAPTRLTDVYSRGDAAEAFAGWLVPATAAAFVWLVRAPSRWRLSVAASCLAALVLSHNLTAYFFAPVLGALVLLAALAADARSRQEVWRSLSVAGLAAALALGLSAFFWVPAVLEKSSVQIERLTTPPQHDWRSNFLTLDELLGPPQVPDRRTVDYRTPHQLGWPQLALGVAGGLAAVAVARRRPSSPRALLPLAMALLGCGAALLTLPLSGPFWEHAPLARYAQFPWRMLGLASFGLAAAAGTIFALLPKRAAVLPAVLLAVALPALPRAGAPDWDQTYVNPTVADVVRYELASGTLGTTSTWEYLPVWVKLVDLPSRFAPVYQNGEDRIERLDRGALPSGVSAVLLAATPLGQRYRVTAPAAFEAIYTSFYFPGWHATVDGREVPIRPYDQSGLITVSLPAGEHELAVSFDDTPLRSGSAAASGLSLLALLYLLGSSARGVGRTPTGANRRSAVATVEEPRRPAERPAGAGTIGLSAWLTTRVGGPVLRDVPKVARQWARSWRALALALGVAVLLSVAHVVLLALPPGGLPGGCTGSGDAAFGGTLRLGCWGLSSGKVSPGGEITVTLYWWSDHPLDRDYAVFAHLASTLDRPPEAQLDHANPGGVPTHRWPAGRWVKDVHVIRVPADAIPSAYHLLIGVYDPSAGGSRLTLPGSADGRLELATVVVGR